MSGGAIALAVGCSGSDGDGTASPGSGSGGAGAERSTGGTAGTAGTATGTGGVGGGEDAGQSEFGPYLASCDYRASSSSLAGRCRDWYGGPNPPSLSSACGDTYMQEPCPSADRVGRCQLDPVVRVVAVYNYYAPTWTPETAMENCVGGTRDNRTWIGEPGLTDGGASDAGGAGPDAADGG